MCFLFSDTSSKLSVSLGTGDDVQRLELTPEDNIVPESLADKAGGPESHRVSCLLSVAASEDKGGGGGCKGRGGGGVCGPEFDRPSSETYLTASDDSSSVFDDDMERTEEPSFRPRGSSEGMQGPCKDGGEEVHTVKLEDSEELNKRFQSQRLDSSSSSSEPSTPSPILTPALIPKRPKPPQDSRDNPGSPKQPRLRTPAGFGLAKKHLSQPPISSEASHGQTRKALSMFRPLQPRETDLNQEQEGVMEKGTDTHLQVLPSSQTAPLTPSSSSESGPGNDSSPPPTPPLHRLPSWVRHF